MISHAGHAQCEYCGARYRMFTAKPLDMHALCEAWRWRHEDACKHRTAAERRKWARRYDRDTEGRFSIEVDLAHAGFDDAADAALSERARESGARVEVQAALSFDAPPPAPEPVLPTPKRINSASMIGGLFCRLCGWPVIHTFCADGMDVEPWSESAYWAYCANKGCTHHAGEDWGTGAPAFAFRPRDSRQPYEITSTG